MWSSPVSSSMMGYEIVKSFYQGGHNSHCADIAAKKLKHMFLDQYDRMLDLLKEDGSLEGLIQVVFGPIVDVKQSDVDELLQYGVIYDPGGGRYSAFSPHFETYLQMVERQISLWPLWSETERTLRHLISFTLENTYGEKWLEKIESKQDSIKQLFDACRLAQERETKAFGSRASQELIDFTYPANLFAIIFAEWKQSFQAIFGKDKSYWSQRSELLSKIRIL